jgi:O-methyltransferase involved in polyketide biosynthesis
MLVVLFAFVLLLVTPTAGLIVGVAPHPAHARVAGVRLQGPPPGVAGGPPGMAGGPPGMAGGPPGMAGGPPGTGGPPAGGGGGGPPPRTAAEQLVDKIFETVFPLLYAFEPEGMLDSEKNLRVLWVRALLAAAGELEDDVAAELLPSATRWVVSAPLARTLWAPVLPKLAWIKQRTQFIDAALDDFLAKTAATTPLERVQVVLIGSGYDTRALRYREAGARFFEVDLPSVLPIKEAMARRYLSSMARREAAASDEADGADAADAAAATSVGGMGRALGLDLNKATMAPPGVFAQLEALGLDRRQPTLVVSEAVLFYLSPPAKRALLQDVGTVMTANAASALVLTDNLAPFVRGPMRQAADAFLSPLGLTVREHDTLWGGAIQFIRADGVASASP